MFYCRNCGAELPGNPRVCAHCGTDQDASGVVGTDQEAGGAAGMDVVVDGTPETCLAQLQGYAARDWPHGGSYVTSPPSLFKITALKRTLIDSLGGVLLLLGLTLITAGAFLPIYGLYWMLGMDSSKRKYQAQVIATPEGSTRTRLSVSASRADWKQTLESWVQQELVENRAAAMKEPQQNGQAAASDIPGQISRLAELRDGGVITTEEFEEKKRELLDRM